MTRITRSAARIFALTSLAATVALGQSRHEVAVQVEDISGAALPGTTIFVHDLGTGLQTSQRTDAQAASTLELRAGRYRITAARTGFEPTSETLDVPKAGKDPVIVRLAPAILMQSVVVSGSREEELLEDSVAKVDMISRRELLDSGYERVSDILAEEPGIITRSSSSGSRSETQIQGIDSRQSLILLDGYPIVGARGIKRGILNMDRQSTNRLDRVEVVKGAS